MPRLEQTKWNKQETIELLTQLMPEEKYMIYNRLKIGDSIKIKRVY